MLLRDVVGRQVIVLGITLHEVLKDSWEGVDAVAVAMLKRQLSWRRPRNSDGVGGDAYDCEVSHRWGMRVESISAFDVSLYMGTLISEQALLVGDLWDR